jgi:hypothetical protein
MAGEAGDGTPFLVIQAISKKSILRLTAHLTARAKRRRKSAQARLLALLFTTLPIFPRSRVMRGQSTCGLGMLRRFLREVCLPLHRVGCNRASTLVIHENDATWGDFALRHLERRRDGAIDKQPFSTAQRQRIYFEPELMS